MARTAVEGRKHSRRGARRHSQGERSGSESIEASSCEGLGCQLFAGARASEIWKTAGWEPTSTLSSFAGVPSAPCPSAATQQSTTVTQCAPCSLSTP
eukprot:750000-Hanusia_phi.AAC.3